jgi:hypothetical protein
MASSPIASKLTSRSAWDGTRTTRKYNGGSNWTATSMYRSTDVNAVASPGMETYQGYKTQDVRWPTRLKSGGVHKVDVEYRLCLVRFCFHFFIPAKKIWGPVWILLIRLNWIRFQRSVYLIAHGIESLILIHFHSITKTRNLSWYNSFPTLCPINYGVNGGDPPTLVRKTTTTALRLWACEALLVSLRDEH